MTTTIATTDKLGLLDQVHRVLAEAGEPLHYREITAHLLSQGLWKSEGKAPHEQVNSKLSVNIKYHSADTRFIRTSPGMFGLKDWTSSSQPSEQIEAPADQPQPQHPSPPASTSTMSFTNAAEHVLKHFAGGKPMHYRKITSLALENGLVSTSGQTPEATLYSQVLMEIERVQKQGNAPRFEKLGKGMLGLASKKQQGLVHQIESHNAQVRKQLHQRLMGMTPSEFEGLVGKLLGALGFDNVNVTGKSGDGGIDVRGTLVVGDVIRTRMAVQVKRWKQNVQAPIVQQVRGSLGTHEQGLIISTSGFSAGAREEAARVDAVPVALMDGNQLVSLLVEHDIGVKRASYDLFDLAGIEVE